MERAPLDQSWRRRGVIWSLVSFGSDQNYNTELNRRCPKYKLLRDVCNGSKHFEPRDLGAVRSTATRGGGFGRMQFGVGGFGEDPYLAVFLDDGSIVRFSDVLGQVVGLWDTVFRNEPCS